MPPLLPQGRPPIVIKSASLNLKYPFGLSLSKPCAALRQAQRERFKQIRAVSIAPLRPSSWHVCGPRPPKENAMGNNTLLAGAALMLLLLVPIWLSPQESLQPSRRTLILLGVAGGLVSIGAFEALRWNAPKLHIVAYPAVNSFFAISPIPAQ